MPVDISLFIYLGIQTVSILIFHRRLPNWGWFLVFHAVIVGTVLTLAITLNDSSTGWKGLLRWGYPILLFTFLYEETGYFLHLFFDDFFDPHLVALEFRLTGAIPSVWLAQHARPWLSEMVMAGYLSYYFIIPIGALILWAKQKTKEFQHMLLAVCIGFFISYLGFSIYPVEGPRFFIPHLHPPPLEGPFFVKVVKFEMDKWAIHGGCMPSSHVAVAVIVLVAMYRGARRWFWALLPLVIGLMVGTVYGRFHYVSDVVVGLTLTPLSFGLASWWLNRFYWRTNVS